MKVVLIFVSTRDTVRAQAVLLQMKIAHELIPAPRQITTHCSSAICVEMDDATMVLNALKKENVIPHLVRYVDGIIYTNPPCCCRHVP